MNVATFPDELRDSASSLRRLVGAGVELDRSEIARALIQRLDFHHDRALSGGPGSLGDPYRAKSEHLGHRVEVVTTSRTIVGTLVGLDLSAGLTVEADEHRVEIHGLDVLSVINRD